MDIVYVSRDWLMEIQSAHMLLPRTDRGPDTSAGPAIDTLLIAIIGPEKEHEPDTARSPFIESEDSNMVGSRTVRLPCTLHALEINAFDPNSNEPDMELEEPKSARPIPMKVLPKQTSPREEMEEPGRKGPLRDNAQHISQPPAIVVEDPTATLPPTERKFRRNASDPQEAIPSI
jgi:hypothetical protein